MLENLKKGKPLKKYDLKKLSFNPLSLNFYILNIHEAIVMLYECYKIYLTIS